MSAWCLQTLPELHCRIVHLCFCLLQQPGTYKGELLFWMDPSGLGHSLSCLTLGITQHNCLPCESNNETLICLKCQEFFRFKSTFRDTYHKGCKLQQCFIVFLNLLQSWCSQINKMHTCGKEQADAFFSLAWKKIFASFQKWMVSAQLWFLMLTLKIMHAPTCTF